MPQAYERESSAASHGRQTSYTSHYPDHTRFLNLRFTACPARWGSMIPTLDYRPYSQRRINAVTRDVERTLLRAITS